MSPPRNTAPRRRWRRRAPGTSATGGRRSAAPPRTLRSSLQPGEDVEQVLEPEAPAPGDADDPPRPGFAHTGVVQPVDVEGQRPVRIDRRPFDALAADDLEALPPVAPVPVLVGDAAVF